jgi:hypothetical protein
MKNFNEKQELNINNCANLKAQVNIYKFFNNQLFLINNLDNDLVIYVKNNIVYTPKCAIINEIEIITETNFCFKEIPIKFVKENRTIMGFLNANKIITLSSENIMCNGLQSVIFLSNNIALEYIDNKVIITDSRKLSNKFTNIQIHKLDEPNFQHSPSITDGLDIIHDNKWT